MVNLGRSNLGEPRQAPHHALFDSLDGPCVVERMSFGDVGQYEHLFGYVEGELDPGHPRNARITNLERAPHNDKGNVEYRADIQILKPVLRWVRWRV